MSAASLPMSRYATSPTLTGRERRRSPRWSVSGQATCVIRTADLGESRHRICSLQLLNVSDTGVGVVSPDAVPVGAQISVFVTAHGPDQGYDLRGTIVRCEGRDDHSHTIGVRLETRRAA